MNNDDIKNTHGYRALVQLLGEARERIQVDEKELDEARRRRGLISAALLTEFGPAAKTYLNGSVAHGDALTPLTDIDLGVIVPNADGRFGPGRKGPRELQDRAADAIRRNLKSEFPNLRVIVEGRKRSVYVSFGDPVDPMQDDFSADVIVAVDHPSGNGLWIPRYDTWDRSHPQLHTTLVRAAVHTSHVEYSRSVRLLKHWGRTHSKPLCSWHVKALALPVLDVPLDQLQGMLTWFDHAIADLTARDTPDPAGVAAPIKTPGPRLELVAKLKTARAKLQEAIDYAVGGYDTLAADALALFFNDDQMLPRPEAAAVARQHSQRTLDQRSARATRTAPAAVTQVRHRTPARSWAP